MTGSMRALALAACCCVAATPLKAQSVADFYKGKQIHFVVGTEAGQDYDTWARLIGRHMRIPGNPTFVIENMPGAGSLIAANYLYNKAPRDGTYLGMVSRNIPNYAIMRQPNADFDPLRLNWIGSPEMTHRRYSRPAIAAVQMDVRRWLSRRISGRLPWRSLGRDSPYSMTVRRSVRSATLVNHLLGPPT
jgi:hypothetical protein